MSLPAKEEEKEEGDDDEEEEEVVVEKTSGGKEKRGHKAIPPSHPLRNGKHAAPQGRPGR